mmetsp:Transcript_14791/g.25627  ORF Transcript_14791/g.25627 Transcript_14791/m.25627 type:complete len:238 (-) Transcript_14791:1839-2552(-)
MSSSISLPESSPSMTTGSILNLPLAPLSKSSIPGFLYSLFAPVSNLSKTFSSSCSLFLVSILALLSTRSAIAIRSVNSSCSSNILELISRIFLARSFLSFLVIWSLTKFSSSNSSRWLSSFSMIESLVPPNIPLGIRTSSGLSVSSFNKSRTAVDDLARCFSFSARFCFRMTSLSFSSKGMDANLGGLYIPSSICLSCSSSSSSFRNSFSFSLGSSSSSWSSNAPGFGFSTCCWSLA